LTLAYCLGLGIPFIVAALAFRRMLGATRWLRRHQQWVSRLGGAMLVVVGVLLVTGWWDLLVGELRVWVPGFTTAV
jgi:cytochrome c-type biogenesis protein